MAVRRRPDETIDSLLRRFKKETLKSEVLKDVRNHEYYVSPSERRRKERAEATRRAKAKQLKQRNY